METGSLQPLKDRTIAVTRMRDQADSLRRFLLAAGAEVIEAPTIELAPVDDYGRIDDALRHVHRYQWLVLTSANGADTLFARLAAVGLDPRCLGGVRVAAIGSATARRLIDHGIRPDLVPPEAVGESMARSLIEQGIAGKRVLLLVADIARTQLVDALQAAGAECDNLVAYKTRCPSALPAPFLEKLDRGRMDWITLTSPSSFSNLLTLLGPDRCEQLRPVKLASIGPVTSRAIREAGFIAAAEAEPHDVAGLVSAIIRAETED